MPTILATSVQNQGGMTKHQNQRGKKKNGGISVDFKRNMREVGKNKKNNTKTY